VGLEGRADALLTVMRTRFRMDSARMGAGVRRVLARGRPARLAACLVVALAAVVWLSVAIAVLRVVFVVVLLLAAVWCVWLVAAVWWGPDWKGPSAGALRRLWARARLAFAVLAADPSSAEQGARELDEPEEAALAAFRRSADPLTVELLGRQERLHADAERLQRELAGQIETMRALVARIAQIEQEGSRLSGDRESTIRDSGRIPAGDLTGDPDLRSAFDELEADLRLEKIEEREQMLGERERRLDRRERELAAFVAETSRLGMNGPTRHLVRMGCWPSEAAGSL
jgi:hypothetical protein